MNQISNDNQDSATKLAEKIREIELKKKEQLTQNRAHDLSMEYIDLKGFPIGPEILGLVGEEKAKEAQVIPFFNISNQTRLATTNPDNPAINDVIAAIKKEHSGINIKLYLTSPHSFNQAMKLYGSVAKVRKVQIGVQITDEQLKHFQQEIKTFPELEKRIPESSMTDAFAMIIASAMNEGSSDIHIEAEEDDIAVRFRIDGLLQVVARLPKDLWHRLISRIKALAGMKLNISNVPQDGRITIKSKAEKMDIRVSCLPTAYGESVVMRLLRSGSISLTFEKLGLRKSSFDRLKKEIDKPNGMVVTTGPTGSGKTTTLYAILSKLNTPETKIITLENPIEYKLKGIAQSQIDHSKDYTFSKGLRSILRQDPDVIMVGEIRDNETAEVAVQAALTGHLLLSTIHTNDAAGAIPRFLSMGVRPFLLAPAVNAIIGQRLVRKICEHCKTEATLEFETLEQVKKILADIPENSGEALPDMNNLKFFKGKGCANCNKGYKGRIGIYEVFTITPEIEAAILGGDVSEYKMRELTHAAGMLTMLQDGVIKASNGMTTIEEVFKVAAMQLDTVGYKKEEEATEV
ncbi:GspE/PulE family protein [Patescibacteria group bacterium]|nr:GspE/PulE family protein [Patescibacteria group bacterium]MBU1673463.1 GspE/PulE family protein [Patescibacteria group bacterium]MBU1962915.1 GspE/PulE family protein [Patescibacteria group bacterium]